MFMFMFLRKPCFNNQDLDLFLMPDNNLSQREINSGNVQYTVIYNQSNYYLLSGQEDGHGGSGRQQTTVSRSGSCR